MYRVRSFLREEKKSCQTHWWSLLGIVLGWKTCGEQFLISPKIKKAFTFINTTKMFQNPSDSETLSRSKERKGSCYPNHSDRKWLDQWHSFSDIRSVLVKGAND